MSTLRSRLWCFLSLISSMTITLRNLQMLPLRTKTRNNDLSHHHHHHHLSPFWSHGTGFRIIYVGFWSWWHEECHDWKIFQHPHPLFSPASFCINVCIHFLSEARTSVCVGQTSFRVTCCKNTRLLNRNAV